MEFKNLRIIENKKCKIVRSSDYNYNFYKKTGYFERWGETYDKDPLYAPAPEILDLEISTICKGIGSGPCKWCYKSNTQKGDNMSFETFKKIFHKLPPTLTQIAFGIGDIDGNPDFFKMMEYCRNNKHNYVVPNVTINGYNVTDTQMDRLAELCGAVSVSMYEPKDVCYDAVKRLTDRGMTQVNIHRLVSHETYEDCLEVMRDYKTDPRLKNLNAIVFLSLKPIGNRNTYKKLGTGLYKNLIDYALKHEVPVGFDSCSAPMFLKAIKSHKNYKQLVKLAEPCESYLFSFYINHEGKTTPCSFLEKRGYKEIDVASCSDFIKDIWQSEEIKKFRERLFKTSDSCIINGDKCRTCPEYDLY